MDLFNPNSKTRFLGKMIPNTIMYGILIVGALFIYKIYSSLSIFFNKILNFFGLGDKPENPADTNTKAITNDFANNPAVKSQLITKNRMLADDIHTAMNGFMIDLDKLKSVFSQITGPNQMKAVYVAFGTRNINVAYIFRDTGTVDQLLKARLFDYQLKAKNIKTKHSKISYSINDFLNYLKK